jgi:hypothetical protein
MTALTEIFAFLDYVEKKSILPRNSVVGKRTACKTVFEVLDDSENTVEFVTANLDAVMQRFCNRSKTDFKGNSLNTYQSKVRSTLKDFREWNESPANWEKSVNSKSKSSRSEKPGSSKVRAKRVPSEVQLPINKAEVASGTNTRRLTFPIRANFDLPVEIPADGLTLTELKRLGAFLMPYCKDFSADTWTAPEWSLTPRKEDRAS